MGHMDAASWVEAPFASTRDALRFALEYSGQAYDRPMMNRMAAPSEGSGKGFVGVDGAGQAGMIGAELKALGPLCEAIIIASYAPEGVPCSCRAPCCSGIKRNTQRLEALDYLCHAAVPILAGCVSHYRLRRGLIEKSFGKKVTVTELAELCGVSRDLAGDHNAKIVAWLNGVRKGVGKPAIEGMISLAFQAIDGRLRDVGMVGAPA